MYIYRRIIILGFLRWCRISSIHSSSLPLDAKGALPAVLGSWFRNCFCRNLLTLAFLFSDVRPSHPLATSSSCPAWPFSHLRAWGAPPRRHFGRIASPPFRPIRRLWRHGARLLDSAPRRRGGSALRGAVLRGAKEQQQPAAATGAEAKCGSLPGLNLIRLGKARALFNRCFFFMLM